LGKVVPKYNHNLWERLDQTLGPKITQAVDQYSLQVFGATFSKGCILAQPFPKVVVVFHTFFRKV
jgi:hypothetical protein